MKFEWYTSLVLNENLNENKEDFHINEQESPDQLSAIVKSSINKNASHLKSTVVKSKNKFEIDDEIVQIPCLGVVKIF